MIDFLSTSFNFHLNFNLYLKKVSYTLKENKTWAFEPFQIKKKKKIIINTDIIINDTIMQRARLPSFA